MRIIARSALTKYYDTDEGKEAKQPLLAWYRIVLAENWSSPADIKRSFATASILKDGRVVFNIGGNKFRLVVWVNYAYGVVYIRFIGTHSEYDRINAQTI